MVVELDWNPHRGILASLTNNNVRTWIQPLLARYNTNLLFCCAFVFVVECICTRRLCQNFLCQSCPSPLHMNLTLSIPTLINSPRRILFCEEKWRTQVAVSERGGLKVSHDKLLLAQIFLFLNLNDQDYVECDGARQEGQTKDQLVSNRLLTDSRWVCLF